MRLLPAALLLGLPLLLTAGATRSQDTGYLALITELSGEVLVSRSDAEAPISASWGMHLYRGDLVTTRAQAYVSIAFPNRYLFELGPESTMTIAGGSAAPAGGDVLIGEEDAGLLADLTLRRTPFGDLAALGGLRSASGFTGGAAITPVAPRNTAVLPGCPVFAWTDPRARAPYRVTVSGADGPVWSGESTDTTLAYPATAPPLRPGARYIWKVEGEDGFETAVSEPVGFEVLSEVDADIVRNTEASIRALVGDGASSGNHDFLIGSLYARHGLLADAIEAFSRIAERHPEAAAVHEMLGTLYQDVDLKDQAIEALNRALSLRK